MNDFNIQGNKQSLVELFVIFLDNAIKYNKKNGRVEVCLQESDDSVKIVVSDTGVGLAQEDLDRVFDKFYRVTMRSRGEARKWGVGLPIVKEIIEMHRGSISAESKLGKGSVFTVTLRKSLR